MNINILYIICGKIGLLDIKNFALMSYEGYMGSKVINRRISAAKTIYKWWKYYRLPNNVEVQETTFEFMYNFPYITANCHIPNLIEPNNVIIMIRYYKMNNYIQFNRMDTELTDWHSFIIGKIDMEDKFIKLSREEFLICLKRFERCVEPSTGIIWRKTVNDRRRIKIGKIDEYYNVIKI